MGDHMIMDVKTVFLKALDTETAKGRQIYLDTACAHDPELRDHVDRLLDAHENATGFLDPEAFDAGALDQPISPEVLGTVIDRYKLLEKLGEGGMAVVYRAQQAQPIRRQVAIKVIKLGMDTKEVIARFEAERHVLAMMDHPNIAKVLDAGVTEAGKPYFVMELVQGISITEYCDENRLNTQQRLALYVSVCQAVHHAHQKGIIHRDLKPSNILVTMRDDMPMPKIIDFGIAKAIHQRLTDKTLFTLHTQLIGTPEYMSPEQADMGDMDIDTRTDIYSLGVVLYELLVGTSPFDATTLRRAAVGEIQRIIREEEPLRPSTRISAMGNAAKEIAARRGTNVAELTKRLNRELEWIPLKAMRKDRTRRYTSASGFADDINNYLSDRPLLAGPESSTYRLRKAAHKYRISVMAVSAVIVTLITGLIISMSLYMRLNRALAIVSQIEQQAKVDDQLSHVQMLHAKGQYQEARQRLDTLLAIQDLGPKAHLTRAQLLLELGQFKPAEDELLQLTTAGLDIAGAAHYLLARIYIIIDPDKVNKHEQLAESMLPETAEGYYVRALTAASADEALTWLSTALKLDTNHYAARKAQAFAHHRVKAFHEMAEDAVILVHMRDQDYMGYALRAIAYRETGQFEQALKDHAHAIELCTLEDERPRLYDQRRITHMRNGHYREALEDAEQVGVLKGEEINYPVLDALMALGEYDEVEAQYKKFAGLSEHTALFSKVGAEKYAFDLLRTGQPFNLPPDIASRSPFYLMEQTSRLHTRLRKKAQPLPINGGSWLGDWSPDGQSIAYCQRSAFGWLPGTLEGIKPESLTKYIEVLDLSSGKTGLITRFGDTPVWSPDRKYIAFTDYNQNGPDVWLVSSAGGEPQKLTPGCHPQWSRDSQHVFFRSHDGMICSVDITSLDSSPVPELQRFPGTYLQPFSISPNESLIADENLGEILILTFPEGEEVARWKMPWPLQIWAGQLQWHPDGKTVILNSHSQYNQMGMCLFDIERAEVSHVLNVTRPWCRTIWSPDGSQLIIDPFAGEDMWLMDIDPNVALTEALAPALTTKEFLEQRLETWNQRIQADPLYAENYVSRAVVLLALKDYDKASQDMDHCNKLINDPNDPACCAIDHWAGRYKSAGRTPEADLWASLKAQLAERFPENDQKSE